jgi:tetratricopeptide (TPR) repeat protein
MKPTAVILFLVLLSCAPKPAPPAPQGKAIAPELKGMGEMTFNAAAQRPEAIRFVRQGLALVYAFNHDEAARAFREAARLDPNCAMAYWGLALALAPNINDPVPAPEREQEAFEAIAKARTLAAQAPESERAYIDALARRFSAEKGKDRLTLNKAYASAMKEVALKYQSDPDAQVLYADAVMNTMPWQYWGKDGRARPEIPPVVELIERTMTRWPDHTGANHLYIHLVEASTTPERATEAAGRLAKLAPAAGHLVHMPSHIYIRTGRYADSMKANSDAVKADDSYLTQCRMQGLYPMAYHPHNWHFLAVSAMLHGDGAQAVDASRKMAKRLHHDVMAQKEWALIQYYFAYPMFAMARFGQWDQILAEPQPDTKLRWATAVYHYTRALASLGKNQLPQASAELAKLKSVAAEPIFKELTVGGFNGMPQLLEIGVTVIEGEMAGKRKDYALAVQLLEHAVRVEDGLNYNEPPDWYYPARHSLGAVLLEAGRPAEAETVFWEDLRRNPENGWALIGLIRSLRAQSRTERVDELQKRLDKAWAKHAPKPPSSRIL